MTARIEGRRWEVRAYRALLIFASLILFVPFGSVAIFLAWDARDPHRIHWLAVGLVSSMQGVGVAAEIKRPGARPAAFLQFSMTTTAFALMMFFQEDQVAWPSTLLAPTLLAVVFLPNKRWLGAFRRGCDRVPMAISVSLALLFGWFAIDNLHRELAAGSGDIHDGHWGVMALLFTLIPLLALIGSFGLGGSSVPLVTSGVSSALVGVVSVMWSGYASSLRLSAAFLAVMLGTALCVVVYPPRTWIARASGKGSGSSP